MQWESTHVVYIETLAVIGIFIYVCLSVTIITI